jgi:hypothetical protein
MLGVTDGVSTRKNGLIKSIFHALHDAMKIKAGEHVGHSQFRPVQSSSDRYVKALFASCPVSLSHKSLYSKLIATLDRTT